jgi:tetratricopeptide (TPR) repeat protein
VLSALTRVSRRGRAPLRRALAFAAALAINAAALAPVAAAPREQGASDPRVSQAIEQARAASLDDESYTRLLSFAYTLVGEARYAEAAQLFGALAAKRPRDDAALYGAALATFNSGRAAEAATLARRAADLALEAARTAQGDAARAFNSRAADALVLLAVAQAVGGQDAASLDSARRAVALAPENFDAQLALGRALYAAGDDSGAARAFRASAALRPADARPLFFLATTLERAGDDPAALAAYRELVAKQPRAPEGHLGLGVLLVKRGGAQTEEGLKELAHALELDPDIYEARVALGRALLSKGRAAESIEHLRRAAELAPNNPEPHYQLSLAYRRLGRKDDAAAESEVVRRIHESRRAPTGDAPPRP